jgi:rubrerythrin
MHILKMLGPLEDLETKMADLYNWFSHVFRKDEEAAAFFYRVSVEEVVHANIIKYQRRLVSQNPKSFSDITIAISLIEKTLSDIAALRNLVPYPELEEALRNAIGLEHCLAEEHYRTALVMANPEISNLLRSLGAFDLRHIGRFHEFAIKRGFKELSQDYVSAVEPEISPADGSMPGGRKKKIEDIDKELLERINNLHKWHKTMGYYKFLGIKDYASGVQIKHAYLRLVKEYHPDMHFDFPDDIVNKLQEIIEYAVDAHKTLLNPEKRKEYDATLGRR